MFKIPEKGETAVYTDDEGNVIRKRITVVYRAWSMCVGVDNNHICELQVVHRSMLNARKGLPGHVYYGIVRNAMEMMDYCPADSQKVYSGDMAALIEFLPPDMDEGLLLDGWLEDDVPLGKWAGVTTNAKQQVVAIDLRILDPKLEQRHRLPHLETLSLSGLKVKVPAKYFRVTGNDYKYHRNFSVSLRGCTEVDDETFEGLTELQGLVAIDLTDCNISDTSLAMLVERNPHLHPDKVISQKKGPAFLAAVCKWRTDLSHID